MFPSLPAESGPIEHYSILVQATRVGGWGSSTGLATLPDGHECPQLSSLDFLDCFLPTLPSVA